MFHKYVKLDASADLAKYSGVCHTDLHAVMGDWPVETKIPLVGGHEGAGVVVARGSLVDDVEIGDHAGVKWINGSCLACEYVCLPILVKRKMDLLISFSACNPTSPSAPKPYYQGKFSNRPITAISRPS
jgi:hypothetical protein